MRELLAPILAPLISCYHPEIRQRFYPPEVVVNALISGVLSNDTTLMSAVIRINADRLQQNFDLSTSNTSAFSKARTKLDSRVLSEAAKKIAFELNCSAKTDPFWMGFTPFAIDGTTLTANDTADNQLKFPQHANQAEGAGFPILRLLILQSLSTGVISDFAYAAFKGKGTGEMALAREVFPSLKENSILLGDSYFPSYFTLAALEKIGVAGLFPKHHARNADFRKGTQIGKRDHLIEIDKPPKPEWMTKEEYETFPEKIKLREVDASREIGNGKEFIIITTLLDNKKYTKAILSKFYKKRWKIEIALRDLKSTFGMDFISANSPEMIEKLILSHFLAYNVLRWHIVNAAQLYQVSIETIGIKKAAKILIENIATIVNSSRIGFAKIFAQLWKLMIEVPVGNRPDRSEPRLIKKRGKPFGKLKTHRSLC